jgi:hypothetical protein
VLGTKSGCDSCSLSWRLGGVITSKILSPSESNKDVGDADNGDDENETEKLLKPRKVGEHDENDRHSNEERNENETLRFDERPTSKLAAAMRTCQPNRERG